MIWNRLYASSVIFAVLATTTAYGAEKKKKAAEPSALDKYIQEALKNEAPMPAQASTGSLWSPSSRLTDIGSDLRAVQTNDLVTIIVNEQASAVATGATKTSRVSSVNSSVSSLAGPKSATGALANLATAANDTELNGAGTTSRGTQLSTTLSARVTHVLPNGYLVLEGSKDVQVNSEHQEVTVRGIIRPIDLSPGNIVSSNQLAQMEIRINGKGVVGDAIRRPWLLYRIILGLLPF
ncbi:MAG TPA: flagellar basal body L-ring protein FlgH [Bryobacteraceae bacterium]|jgi:flagellar L-ring protein precursor FlgH|nr:flagellar basal body L-ring protein FlgH [Bryobacteraceae bacterium]